MNLASAGLPMNALYAILKLATSNYMYSVQKFSPVLNITGRMIWPMGVIAALGTIPWKGA
jgi:hypothetical protein